MVSLKIQEWLAPDIKKERDLLAIQVHDLKQRLNEAHQVVSAATMDNQRLRFLVESLKQPETPKIFKAGTSAEVRRATEQAFALVEEKDGV